MKRSQRPRSRILSRALAVALGLALLAAGACSGTLPEESLIAYETPEGLARLATSLEQRVQAHPADDAALRRLARVELRQGRLAPALVHAQRAVQEAPFSGLNHLVLGETFEASGKPARAAVAYGQAIELAPNLLDAYVRYAHTQASLHVPDKAFKALDEALRREPKLFGALVLRAQLLREAQRLPEALEVIEAARALRPDDVLALRVHVQILRGRGQLDAARRLAEQGLAHLAGPAPAGTPAELATRQAQRHALLANLAGLAVEQGDGAAALAVLDRLAKLGPLSGAESLLRVDALEVAGRTAESEAALQQVLRTHPDLAAAHARRAEALVRGGQPREALREAQQARALAPDQAAPAYWEAVAHFELNDAALGQAALAVAASLAPQGEAIALLQIERLLREHHAQGAAARLDQLQQRAPELAALPLLRSELAAQRGQLDLAEQLLGTISPRVSAEQVRFARLRIAYLRKRWADVAAESQPLLRHPRLGWRAAYLGGTAQLQQGDWAAGLATVNPQLEGANRRDLFYPLAGYLHLLQGDRQAAQRTFTAGLALKPDDPLNIEGLSRMAMEAQDWPRAQELLEQGLAKPGRFRALFLDRLVRVAQARKDAQLSRDALRRYLEASDPARVVLTDASNAAVLYGVYIAPFDPWRGG